MSKNIFFRISSLTKYFFFDGNNRNGCKVVRDDHMFCKDEDFPVKFLIYSKNKMFGMINLDLEEVIPFKYVGIIIEHDMETAELVGFSCYLENKGFNNKWDSYDKNGLPCDKTIIENCKEKNRIRSLKQSLNKFKRIEAKFNDLKFS